MLGLYLDGEAIAVAGGGTDDGLVHAPLPQELLALDAVLVGPPLEIQVVEDAHHLPKVGLLTVAQFLGEPAHHVAHHAGVPAVELPLVVSA